MCIDIVQKTQNSTLSSNLDNSIENSIVASASIKYSKAQISMFHEYVPEKLQYHL